MGRVLIIDGQVFQTPAWHRGMGKYSLELIATLVRFNQTIHHWESVELILSNKLNIESTVVEIIKDRCKGIKLVYLPLHANEYDNLPVANTNRKAVDQHIRKLADNLKSEKIDYLVLSLMQSEIAPSFPSLASVHNMVLFYDIIPLMFYKTYLIDSLNRKVYLSKLAELLRADTYLCISKTVANDLCTVLGIDPERITSIDGASIEHGKTASEINVPRPFILMPTGNDLRKNNRRGVEGFQAFNEKNDNKYTLVITSSFENYEIAEYKNICPNIVFTGNVKGEELEYLYTNTDALLFPTEYEGLGLPILEALEKKKPVACSDISVFREMSDSAFFYFNPKQPSEIAQALSRAVTAPSLPLNEYKKVLKKYTWQRTAELFFERSKKEQEKTKFINGSEKIALFCPNPEQTKYGAEIQQIYSEIQRLKGVSYYLDESINSDEKNINYLIHITDVTNISQPSVINIPKATLPLYFIENNSACAAVLLVALANPGIAVLKELQLEDLWTAAVSRGLIDHSRLQAEKKLSDIYKIDGLLSSILASQKAIIVENKKDQKRLEEISKNLPEYSRPKVIYAKSWHPSLVYKTLNPDFSMVDYPTNITSKASLSSTPKDYAQNLYKLLSKNIPRSSQ